MLIFFFLLIFIFALSTMIYGPPAQTGDSLDYMIEIGRFQDEPRKAVKSVKTEKPSVDPLYEDCVLVLVGLGEKKSSAKKDAKRILETNKVDTVEDFIRLAYAR